MVIESVAYHVFGFHSSGIRIPFELPSSVSSTDIRHRYPYPFSNTRLSGERKKIGGGIGRQAEASQATFPGSIGLSGSLTLPQPLPLTSQPDSCFLFQSFIIRNSKIREPRVKPNFLFVSRFLFSLTQHSYIHSSKPLVSFPYQTSNSLPK